MEQLSVINKLNQLVKNVTDITLKPIPTISLCCIVKNEEDNIIPFLKCWKDYVDEVCLVDTGSTDETVGAAKKYSEENNINLIVKNHLWEDDFAKARNLSLSMATKDWIIWSDADDRISAESAANINTVISKYGDTADGVIFNIKCLEPGDKYHEIAQTRMFKRSLGLQFVDPIHESLPQKDGGKNVYAPQITIEHLGYTDPNLLKKKRDRNDRIIEKNLLNPKMLFFYSKKLYGQNDYWGCLGALLFLMKRPELSDQLKSEACYWAGRVFIQMDDFETARIWLAQSDGIDSKYYLGACYDKLGDPVLAKESYSEYILYAENAVPVFGTLKKQLLPVALKRIQEICGNELKHWSEFKLLD